MNLPVINMWFAGLPLGLFFIAFTIAILELRLINRKKSIIFKIAASIAVLCILYVISISIATWPGFRAGSYRDLIGEVKTGENFSKDVAPISVDKIRIVDQEVAHRLGDKVIGQDPGLGSKAHLGDFRIQKVKDQLYWVAPLLHSGFFKWFRNSGTGTGAYVMVSATNERDVELVQKIGDKDIQIKYQPEGFFGQNLHRHLYMHGYMTTGVTDFTFEIDDAGHPYWVITLYGHDVGFSGANPYGIAVVDATTGEINEYTPDTAPEWVDRIQPWEIVQEQLDNWGEYIHGFWNFSNEGKLTSTSGVSLVYGEDNRSYWYTGLTSVGSDEGTVGFVLVDTRTKETTWYPQSGATEEAARRSAMGKVQEKGYVSSFPIMYNIDGVATYVMSLKDQARLIKMIALVSVEDFSIVGVGDNLKDALRAYKDAYNSSGNNSVFSEPDNLFEVDGRVQRINTDINNGNAYYYFTLTNVPNKLFSSSSNISTEIPLTQVNDSVRVFYQDGRAAVIEAMNFDNLELDIKATDKSELTQ
ncbi:MAG: hypothetical protein GY810_20615 [Aureispira sp.]|nr:hypothetical protein [Aureispira sp.]